MWLYRVVDALDLDLYLTSAPCQLKILSKFFLQSHSQDGDGRGSQASTELNEIKKTKCIAQ